MDEALAIKNTDIVTELALPPVKIHCSVLAEDAIKAAIADYKKKQDDSKGAARFSRPPANGTTPRLTASIDDDDSRSPTPPRGRSSR